MLIARIRADYIAPMDGRFMDWFSKVMLLLAVCVASEQIRAQPVAHPISIATANQYAVPGIRYITPSCEALANIDQSLQANGALLMYYGCRTINAAELGTYWSSLPESAHLALGTLYIVPGERYPDFLNDSRHLDYLESEASLLHFWSKATILVSQRAERGVRGKLSLGFETNIWKERMFLGLASLFYHDLPIEDGYISITRGSSTDIKITGNDIPLVALYSNDPPMSQLSNTPIEAVFGGIEEVAGALGKAVIDVGSTVIKVVVPPGEDEEIETNADTASQRRKASLYPPALLITFRNVWPSLVANDFEGKGELSELKAVIRNIEETGFIPGIREFAAESMRHKAVPEEIKEQARGLLFEAAEYGDPYSQALLGEYLIEGYGLSKDELLGADYLIKASDRGSWHATKLLFHRSMERGAIEAAFKYATRNTGYGLIAYEDAGHVAVASLIGAVNLTEDTKIKLLSTLKDQCLNNPITIGDKEDCEHIDVDSKKTAFDAGMLAAIGAQMGQRGKAVSKQEIYLETGNYHALIIANEQYEFLGNLSAPKQDAGMLGRTLKEDYGFEVDYLFDATRADILRHINALQKSLGVNDNLLVYYAGHGTFDSESGIGYWQPVDASPTEDFTWIETDRLTAKLSSFSSRNIFVVADSCFSGAVFRSSDGLDESETGDQRALQTLIDRKTRVALASGGLEPIVDVLGMEETSIFSQEFVKILELDNEFVTASNIFHRLRAKVASRARASGYEQVPEFAPLYGAGHDGGDFVFVRRGASQ